MTAELRPRPVEVARSRADVLRRESNDLLRLLVALSAVVAEGRVDRGCIRRRSVAA